MDNLVVLSEAQAQAEEIEAFGSAAVLEQGRQNVIQIAESIGQARYREGFADGRKVGTVEGFDAGYESAEASRPSGLPTLLAGVVAASVVWTAGLLIVFGVYWPELRAWLGLP